MLTRFAPALFVLLAALIMVGCQNVDKRISSNLDYFGKLDADKQQRLREGKLALGDTTADAYIALGEPDAKYNRLTRNGNFLIWSYWDRYLEPFYEPYYLHRDRYAYHRHGAWGPFRDTYAVERLRLIFKEGELDQIETTDPR